MSDAPKDADPDTESTLQEMKELKELIDRSQKKYEELRDAIVDQIDGPRYFMTASGQKLYAYRQQNTKLIVDEGTLWEAKAAGEITDEIFADLYKSVFDEDAFKRHVAAKRIPMWLAKKATRILPKGKPFIRYGDPEKPAREA